MICNSRQARLIDRIYEAGSQLDGWQDAVCDVMREVGGVHAALAVNPKHRAAEPSDLVAAVGGSSGDVDEYVREFAGHNFRRDRLFELSAGDVSADGHDIALVDVDASYIHNEYFRPRGWGYATYAWLYSTEQQRAYLALHRDSDAVGFGSEQIDTLKCLVPHLARSLMIHGQLERAQACANGLAIALDHFPFATILVDAQCKFVCCNRWADDLMRQPNLPLKTSLGALVAARSDDTGRLQRAVSGALAILRGERLSSPTVLRFPRTDGDGAVTLLVSPLLGATRFGGASDAAVMLCLSDRPSAKTLNPQVLACEFELTPSEAHIAAQIGGGATIAEIAHTRSVSIETVRTQVRGLMSKTQTHNQGQLASVIVRSLASVSPTP